MMDKKNLLIKEIGQVPDEYIDEVLDFVRFLKSKSLGERMEIPLMSEAALKKDWLKPEEDEAWQSL